MRGANGESIEKTRKKHLYNSTGAFLSLVFVILSYRPQFPADRGPTIFNQKCVRLGKMSALQKALVEGKGRRLDG